MNAITSHITSHMTNPDIQTAWSGVKTFNAESAKEALSIAGLDWTVSAQSVMLANGQEVPNTKAIVRSDNSQVLGVVGGAYQTVQNDSLAFFDEIRQVMPDLRYVSAGSIGGGRRVWLLADFGAFEAQRGDIIRKQIMLFNSHDGTTALSYAIVPNRIFCNNQVAMTLTKGTFLKLRHSASTTERLKDAEKVALSAVNNYEHVEGCFKALASKPLSVKMVDKALDTLFPLVTNKDGLLKGRGYTCRINVRAQIERLIDEGMGISDQPRNGFSVYNAFSEYMTHHTPVYANGGQERRWENNVWGKSRNDMDDVMKCLLAV